MTYDDFTMEQILRKILPENVVVPSSFEAIGHIAHLNLKPEHFPYKEIIGQVLLDKNHSIRTVVNKIEAIHNQFRTPELEILAGEPELETIAKEGKCKFKLNYKEVYWNSRLQTERDRMLTLVKPNETICDMFCGVGPFSIRAAKKGCKVLANDLNTFCYDYLKINAEMNKVSDLVQCYNMDAREFIKYLLNKENLHKIPEKFRHFDHVYMNLPGDAISFLDVFKGRFVQAPSEV